MTGRTSSAHPNPKIEVRAGEFLVTCRCGKLRPNEKPHGWREGQRIEWPDDGPLGSDFIG